MPLLCLSLGSNLNAREQNLRRALLLLTSELGMPASVSSFAETPPWGFTSPHTFLNAAAVWQTNLPPNKLLFITQRIERQIGRKQKTQNAHYADRLIDIDLLLYGNLILDQSFPDGFGHAARLILPHPLMHRRLFVLQPLKEIAPQALHPVFHKTVAQLLDELQTNSAK